MAADLREMQENQGFSENRIDKLEFVGRQTVFSVIFPLHGVSGFLVRYKT